MVLPGSTVAAQRKLGLTASLTLSTSFVGSGFIYPLNCHNVDLLGLVSFPKYGHIITASASDLCSYVWCVVAPCDVVSSEIFLLWH